MKKIDIDEFAVQVRSRFLAANAFAGLGVLLTVVGYDGSLVEQSAGTLMGIRMLFSIVPMVLFILVAITLMGYFRLDKQMNQIRQENEERRAATQTE